MCQSESSQLRPLPWWRRLRRSFYYRLLLFVLFMARRMPLKAGRRVGVLLARLAVKVRPADRQRALSNLALAFPARDSHERRQIFEASVRALGENFHDTLVAPDILSDGHLVCEEAVQGRDSLVDELTRLAHSGRGVLILTGHLGCWELLGGWLAKTIAGGGFGPLAVVTGTIHNESVNRLVQERRRRSGLKVIPRSEGAGPLLRHLKAGGIAAVLLDQNTKVENLPIPFFGQEAPTPSGFARIALRYGVPVLPVAIARQGQRHEVRRTEAWISGQGQGDHEKSVRELLQWCNFQLQDFIERNPSEWVWFHRRWVHEGGPSGQKPV